MIKSDLTFLKASEKEVIDKVIDQFSDWSATSISNYSHNDMPWRATKEGEMIDVKVLEVDRAGRIKLSRKALLQ